MRGREVIDKFIETTLYQNSVSFTASDIASKVRCKRSTAQMALEMMLVDEKIVPVSKDKNGNNRYQRWGSASRLLRKPWRKKDVGELKYYRGTQYFREVACHEQRG